MVKMASHLASNNSSKQNYTYHLAMTTSMIAIELTTPLPLGVDECRVAILAKAGGKDKV
jgi:hypothetical protein